MRPLRHLANVLLSTALVAALGCAAKSHAEPGGTPKSKNPPAETAYEITVTADPPDLTVGSGTPTTITVDVRQSSDGLPPDDLTRVALSTDLGSFGSVSGPAEAKLQLIGGSSQADLFAGSSAGTATVRARIGSSSADWSFGGANVRIASLGTFSVTGIVPNVGGPRGGESVEILGTGFDPPVAVRIGTAAASVVSVSPNRLRVLLPAALAATGRDPGAGEQVVANVEVTINVNEAQPNRAVLTNGFTYTAGGDGQPRIVALSPTSGANDTGAAAIPPWALKHAPKVLIRAMGPGSGAYTGGTKVTISGQGFDGRFAVSLGGVGQIVRNVSGPEIVFTTAGIPVTACPASGFVTATGVRVVDIDTGGSHAADLRFDYVVPQPHVFGVSPASGGAGTTLTLTGVNFAPNVQVQLGDPTAGLSAQVVYVNPTTVVARVPAAGAGFAFKQVPCGATGTRDAPTPLSVTVRNLDGPGCFVTFTNGFLLNPSDAASAPQQPPEPSLIHRLLHLPSRARTPSECQGSSIALAPG